MNIIKEKLELNGREIIIETGLLASQADGAVTVTYGETVVLATCCVSEAENNFGFFPLTVDYRERTYAAGKIPGGFFKREGRPNEKEIITSRLIDRPIRPLFPEGYKDEIQVIITVLSSDNENNSDIPSMIGGSCAIALSKAPFEGPIGVVRIGKINNEYVINPTFEDLEKSEFELIVAGTESGITMLEGGSSGTTEDNILSAIDVAKSAIDSIVALQKKITDQAGSPKKEFQIVEIDDELKTIISDYSSEKITDVYRGALSKHDRQLKLDAIRTEILEKYVDPDDDEKISLAKNFIEKLMKKLLRKLLTEEKIRVDGRHPNELRPITCSYGLLPRTHGSGLYTKGETQSLSVATLGNNRDQQIMDALTGEYKKNFMLHYNFPPFAVGECRPNRGPGRREIGHGLLAEKAITPSLPDKDGFPYTIRLVSDILESNGSSSMATVCAGTIALMDAGVPIKFPVAGVGMGIIDNVILTDIMGDEDHAGDMDFKVAGSRDGLTAIQMDIKISSVSLDILKEALEEARKARIHTLDEIAKTISKPRDSLSKYAPNIETMTINPKKIGALIGPGGKNIKEIQESTDSVIEIDDDGTVAISSSSREMMQEAIRMVKLSTDDAEVGRTYEGTVKNILDFGAFVEILPGKEGLVHISELAPYRVEKVTDILKVGDKVKVKCLGIDERGKIKLSRVKALNKKEFEDEKQQK